MREIQDHEEFSLQDATFAGKNLPTIRFHATESTFKPDRDLNRASQKLLVPVFLREESE